MNNVTLNIELLSFIAHTIGTAIFKQESLLDLLVRGEKSNILLNGKKLEWVHLRWEIQQLKEQGYLLKSWDGGDYFLAEKAATILNMDNLITKSWTGELPINTTCFDIGYGKRVKIIGHCSKTGKYITMSIDQEDTCMMTKERKYLLPIVNYKRFKNANDLKSFVGVEFVDTLTDNRKGTIQIVNNKIRFVHETGSLPLKKYEGVIKYFVLSSEFEAYEQQLEIIEEACELETTLGLEVNATTTNQELATEEALKAGNAKGLCTGVKLPRKSLKKGDLVVLHPKMPVNPHSTIKTYVVVDEKDSGEVELRNTNTEVCMQRIVVNKKGCGVIGIHDRFDATITGIDNVASDEKLDFVRQFSLIQYAGFSKDIEEKRINDHFDQKEVNVLSLEQINTANNLIKRLCKAPINEQLTEGSVELQTNKFGHMAFVFTKAVPFLTAANYRTLKRKNLVFKYCPIFEKFVIRKEISCHDYYDHYSKKKENVKVFIDISTGEIDQYAAQLLFEENENLLRFIFAKFDKHAAIEKIEIDLIEKSILQSYDDFISKNEHSYVRINEFFSQNNLPRIYFGSMCDGVLGIGRFVEEMEDKGFLSVHRDKDHNMITVRFTDIALNRLGLVPVKRATEEAV